MLWYLLCRAFKKEKLYGSLLHIVPPTPFTDQPYLNYYTVCTLTLTDSSDSVRLVGKFWR